jgi:hypothetical protein
MLDPDRPFGVVCFPTPEGMTIHSFEQDGHCFDAHGHRMPDVVKIEELDVDGICHRRIHYDDGTWRLVRVCKGMVSRQMDEGRSP